MSAILKKGWFARRGFGFRVSGIEIWNEKKNILMCPRVAKINYLPFEASNKPRMKCLRTSSALRIVSRQKMYSENWFGAPTLHFLYLGWRNRIELIAEFYFVQLCTGLASQTNCTQQLKCKEMFLKKKKKIVYHLNENRTWIRKENTNGKLLIQGL